MKKILICLLCMASFITLTGCNTKKEKVEQVECSISEDADEFILNTSVKFDLKDNKLDGAVFVAEYILNEDYIKYKDNFVEGIEKEFANFKKQYGVSYEVVGIDEGARVTINMTSEQLGKIYDIDVNEEVTKEELIDEFKNSGYTCK